MIAVDTSALMAVLLDEPETTACVEALSTSDRIVVSAGTVAEAMIVAERRGVGAEMAELMDGLSLEVVNVTLAVARRGRRKLCRMGQGCEPGRIELRRLLCPRNREDP